MLVKELIEQLQKLPPDARIEITDMDMFECGNFEVKSYDPDQDDECYVAELIMPVYINDHDEEDMVKCVWCGEFHPVEDCKEDVDLGYLCDSCIRAIKSRGENLIFKE